MDRLEKDYIKFQQTDDDLVIQELPYTSLKFAGEYPINNQTMVRVFRIKNMKILVAKGLFNYNFSYSDQTRYAINVKYENIIYYLYGGSLQFAVEGRPDTVTLYTRFERGYCDSYLSTPGPATSSNFSLILIGSGDY